MSRDFRGCAVSVAPVSQGRRASEKGLHSDDVLARPGGAGPSPSAAPITTCHICQVPLSHAHWWQLRAPDFTRLSGTGAQPAAPTFPVSCGS